MKVWNLNLMEAKEYAMEEKGYEETKSGKMVKKKG
jgi:hypothetical protein